MLISILSIFLCPVEPVKMIYKFLGYCLQIESGETDAWLS